jgi:hypothetical protein
VAGGFCQLPVRCLNVVRQYSASTQHDGVDPERQDTEVSYPSRELTGHWRILSQDHAQNHSLCSSSSLPSSLRRPTGCRCGLNARRCGCNVRVPAEQLRVELKLAGLAPGIYHYTLRGPQGTIGSGKLAVER